MALQQLFAGIALGYVRLHGGSGWVRSARSAAVAIFLGLLYRAALSAGSQQSLKRGAEPPPYGDGIATSSAPRPSLSVAPKSTCPPVSLTRAARNGRVRRDTQSAGVCAGANALIRHTGRSRRGACAARHWRWSSWPAR